MAAFFSIVREYSKSKVISSILELKGVALNYWGCGPSFWSVGLNPLGVTPGVASTTQVGNALGKTAMTLLAVVLMVGSSTVFGEPDRPLRSDGITHIAVAWSNEDKPLLDRIAKKAPLHALWLAMGRPVEVADEIYFNPVRFMGGHAPRDPKRARKVLEQLETPFLLELGGDSVLDPRSLADFDDLMLKEGEDAWSLRENNPFTYLKAELRRTGTDEIDLAITAERFLVEDRDARPLPVGPRTTLRLRIPAETRFRNLTRKIPENIRVYEIAGVSFENQD